MNKILCKLQSLLDEREWTLYKLAKESGVPYSSISTMYRNDNHPTISTLEKFCNGLNISMAEFFSEDTPCREPNIEAHDELQLIYKYRKLSSKNKQHLLDIATILNG
ncbi:MAG: helix-turn-helix transcriptional regulator [Lachnospiraceae bacterium]|nr:helix-turn-helix transcriptional regulator [Lachnospiraceae bacterium]